MKTFQQFLEESYLILERSKPKFRGTRTPEEIEALRAERRAQKQWEEKPPSETSQSIISKARKNAKKLNRLIMKPGVKPNTDSPEFKDVQLYQRMATVRQNPMIQGQVIDTRSFSAATKDFLRRKERLSRQKEASKGLNPDVVKPSEHPDTHPSKASEFDRIVHKRRRKRNKQERNREATDIKGRKFRTDQIRDTIGRIPGQLRRR